MTDRLDRMEKSISELKEEKKQVPQKNISYSATPEKMGISVEARAKLEEKDKNA